MMLSLKERESVVVAWAERHEGPGWSNFLVHVIVRRADGTMYESAIQPEEQSATMLALFSVCEAATKSLTRAVRNELGRSKP